MNWSPQRRTVRMRTLPYDSWNVTWKLVLVNVIVFLMTSVSPNLGVRLAMVPSFILQGWVWEFFTYMFVHSGVQHIFWNMFSLVMFGIPVENQLGSSEFLLAYLLTGVFSGVVSFLCYLAAGVNVMLVGASGAIFGVMVLFAVFYPRARIFIFGLIPIKAPLMIIIYTAIELYSQLFGAGGNVAHITHLAGALGAFLYCLVRLRINPVKVFRYYLHNDY
ncbi:MAG: rhomboid family intramembrane serine protease [Sphaerochaeta sp.]|nr:rhomboid family intramembrane serine protease [Sphaerochaeta sp.]MCI2045839.1 rhomboid family intramembrane serine protease [Sphaerochaeta sp.]MCI2076627.1 rhomboid family intramembrane serine protease [Sphaerochaeta sp.]MCI2097691.1 rhomboid family intramembrane serine protease [Sphaerochaeta sp.]MCI2104960.1 rhomboid family intramembrane serine protease [Sphaerochaeta sp.]